MLSPIQDQTRSPGWSARSPSSANQSPLTLAASIPRSPSTPGTDMGWSLHLETPHAVPAPLGISAPTAFLTADETSSMNHRATVTTARASPKCISPVLVGEEQGAARSTIGLKLHGLVVVDMIVGGPAHESGLQVGDILVEADGIQLSDLTEALRALTMPDEPGSVLRLKLCACRADTRLTLTCVGEKPCFSRKFEPEK